MEVLSHSEQERGTGMDLRMSDQATREILSNIPGLSSAAQEDIMRHLAEIRQFKQTEQAEAAATRMVELSHRYSWCLDQLMPVLG